uniref:Uncharacterized protein n=1 Tax=Serinus canaria TaxID=9135 RepID=A0A8C9NEB6_SERCA
MKLKFVPFVSLAVAAVRGQLQQEPFLEIVEGTSISIKCSHPNIKTGDFIYFYRQLPGQSPELLAMTTKAPKEVRAPKGRMSPDSASHRTAAGCPSASASRPPATAAAAALSVLCKAQSCSLRAPGLGADQAAALTGTQELIHGVLLHH